MRLAHRLGSALLTGAVTAILVSGNAVAHANPAANTAVPRSTVSVPKTLPDIPDTKGNGPVPSGFFSAWLYSQLNPDVAPSGANDFACTPKDGQNPIVLIHGTIQNVYNNWSYFSPILKRAGYCVFAPNYGRTDLLDQGGLGTVLPGVHAVASIRQSSDQLARYIDRVRTATGSDKVDVIGASQGGLVARHYLKFNGGANAENPDKNKVERLIMFGSPNHGTTLWGFAALGRALADVGIPVMENGLSSWLYGAGAIDQGVGSPAIKAINAERMTYPGIEYTSVATRYDQVVHPYDTAFIRARGVENLTLQDGCEADTSDHLSMMYSSRSVSIALRALDPERFGEARCNPNVWLFSF